MATVKPYPDDAPFVPVKPDEPIRNDLTLRGTPRKTRHRGVRTKIRDKEFCKMVFSLALDGHTNRAIAGRMHTSESTISYILHAMDIEQARRDSLKHLGRSLADITEMVVDDTLKYRDRRLGKEILENTGILDAARPTEKREEGGRIVIEWDGPPPPWAPRPVLDAHQATLAPATAPAPADEPKKGSSGVDHTDQSQNVIDAEVCEPDNA